MTTVDVDLAVSEKFTESEKSKYILHMEELGFCIDNTNDFMEKKGIESSQDLIVYFRCENRGYLDLTIFINYKWLDTYLEKDFFFTSFLPNIEDILSFWKEVDKVTGNSKFSCSLYLEKEIDGKKCFSVNISSEAIEPIIMNWRLWICENNKFNYKID